jgi:biopolymer transport protein ExbB
MLSDHLFSAFAYLESGGEVMLPLIGISLWMWTLILRKLRELYACSREDLSPGLRLEDRKDSAPGSQGLQASLLRKFHSLETGDPALDRKQLQAIVKQQCASLERGVTTILMLAGVAPLLGLLGTVNGMITTFDVMHRFGAGNAGALAGGISEALITTQSGLAVAIPGLFMGRFILRRVARCQGRMERFGLALARELAWSPHGSSAPREEERET